LLTRARARVEKGVDVLRGCFYSVAGKEYLVSFTHFSTAGPDISAYALTESIEAFAEGRPGNRRPFSRRFPVRWLQLQLAGGSVPAAPTAASSPTGGS
jgi:hypothetical protein